MISVFLFLPVSEMLYKVNDLHKSLEFGLFYLLCFLCFTLSPTVFDNYLFIKSLFKRYAVVSYYGFNMNFPKDQ